MQGKQMLEYQVGKDDAGLSMKSFLLKNGLSRHFLISLRDRDKVTVDGQVQMFWIPLLEGQKVILDPYSDEPSAVVPVEMVLEILYEDGDYIALNKPYDVATHPVKSFKLNTLANGALHHLNKQGILSIHPVSRLDKTTSGVIVFAKHPLAQHAFAESRNSKEYRALVEGRVAKDSELIDLPIAKVEAPSIRRIVTERGKEARTEYHVLRSNEKYSLLRILLHTGRTHQIRVHLSHIGHPLVGDFLYGEENAPRLFLHSTSICFTHYRLKRELCIEAPLPAIFDDYLGEASER